LSHYPADLFKVLKHGQSRVFVLLRCRWAVLVVLGVHIQGDGWACTILVLCHGRGGLEDRVLTMCGFDHDVALHLRLVRNWFTKVMDSFLLNFLLSLMSVHGNESFFFAEFVMATPHYVFVLY